MPIYEYRCGGCGRKFEKIVLGPSAGDPACPRCGGSEVERLASRFTAVGSSKSEADDGGEFEDAGLDSGGENGWDDTDSAGGGGADWEDPGEAGDGGEEGGGDEGDDGDDLD